MRAIESHRLTVNGLTIHENVAFDPACDIYMDHVILKPRTPHVYIAFYKPRGIETTHNKAIEHNLTTVFTFDKPLGFAGRLDKESEGLLLFSNDGKYIQRMSSPVFEKEKEYEVTVDKTINETFLTQMASGVDIRIGVTKPCQVKKISECEFKIILTEGKNRQIRRMCKALGYTVVKLVRTRIDNITIDGLKPGEYKVYMP